MAVKTRDEPTQQRARVGLLPKILLAVVSGAIGAGLALALALLFIVTGPVGLVGGLDHETGARIKEANNVRFLVEALLAELQAPLDTEGKLDVYRVLRSNCDDDQEYILMLCTSQRTEQGPSWRMIKAGDYLEFPYERAKGPIRKGDRTQLLFWDREPDEDGKRLVARGDGSVDWMTEEEFRRLRARGR